jgi:hypothetical protein
MRFKEHYFTEAEQKGLKPELHRDWDKSDKRYPGKRGDVFVDKVLKKEPFQLLNNTTVVLSLGPKDIATLKKMRDDQDYSNFEKRIVIKDVNGKVYSLTDFAKTKEFGGQWKASSDVSSVEDLAGLSTEFEKAIANEWNKSHGHKATIPMPYVPIQEAAEKIVVELSKSIKDKSEAIYTGAMRANDVSDYWKVHATRPDKTPKTDIWIGKNKISLKVGKATQLCSANIIQGEGQALVYNAMDKSEDIPKKLRTEMESWFKKDKEGHNKLATVSDTKEFGEELFQANHELVNQTFKKLTTQSKDFSLYFCLEAMTGDKKFEEVQDSEMAIANYLLAVDKSGDRVMLHKAEDKYAQKIAQQVQIYVSFKSSGGSKASAVRSRVVSSQNNSYVYSVKSLTEYCESLGINTQVLNEGIFDWFKKAWNMIVELVKKGISYLMKFLGIEVDKVDIQGNDDVNFF